MRRYFRKYGDVESIEIIKPTEQEAEEATKPEAHLTFKRDVSAHVAVKDYDKRISKKLKCQYIVEPADTWKQPVVVVVRQPNSVIQRFFHFLMNPIKPLQPNSIAESMISNDDVPPMLKLNEDCFEVLFQYLDIDSSRSWANTLAVIFVLRNLQFCS